PSTHWSSKMLSMIDQQDSWTPRRPSERWGRPYCRNCEMRGREMPSAAASSLLRMTGFTASPHLTSPVNPVKPFFEAVPSDTSRARTAWGPRRWPEGPNDINGLAAMLEFPKADALSNAEGLRPRHTCPDGRQPNMAIAIRSILSDASRRRRGAMIDVQ